MKVAIASDHAGFALKTTVAEWLRLRGHDVMDLGPTSAERVDYPDFAHRLARVVADGQVERGVLVCGSGIGMAIAANRHPGVRAVNVTLEYQAQMAREHNDANVLCLGERVLGVGLVESLLTVFFSTAFAGGRHAARVEKIEKLS
jgi:ribose 5-phosphate isomerase B